VRDDTKGPSFGNFRVNLLHNDKSSCKNTPKIALWQTFISLAKLQALPKFEMRSIDSLG
jgi:hypothetical protein